ncbi:MAG: thermonuclease family protein [Dinoroseobacter sp.]|nr:thermonuclease family protein [Dinoroseobacter sp.]
MPRSQKAPKPLRAAEPAAPQKPKDHHRTHAAADDFGRPRIHPITPAARGSKLSGRVWVIDGDTICIGRTKIRLAGIDAPEIDMPFGQKSKWAMVDLCKGQRVTVVMHGETSYDRQVGTAYLPDGRDIGAEIIKRGLALDLAVFSGGKYREFEPKGARHRLAGGRFGHRSLYGKHS